MTIFQTRWLIWSWVLMDSVSNKTWNIVELLIGSQINITLKNDSGQTAEDIAKNSGSHHIYINLVKKHARKSNSWFSN